MKYWVGVVSREHAKRGEQLGIAQAGHGKRTGLARMHKDDGIVYYSPYETLDKKEPVQSFTIIGQVADNEIWQADEGEFKPWRRRVDYTKAAEAPIRPVLEKLSFTAGRKSWGYAFRFGLFEVTAEDFSIIAKAMKVK
jgi:hypothetical protein